VLVFHCLTPHAALPNMGGADMGGADMGGADMGGADMGGADMGGADMGGADTARPGMTRPGLPPGRLLRLSADFRWQLAGRPAPAELVFGQQGQPPELFSRILGREPWWRPVPAGLTLVPRAQLAAVPPGPSRFFTVHPAWRRWQAPRGPVH
jgi:hypothetical protein